MTVAVGAGTALEISGLTVAYRRRHQLLRAVSDVSLSIRRGEAYGLVGESGCGKTTVAMAVMNYLPPNAVVEAGRVEVDGDDILRLSESRLRRGVGRKIAMVYQDPGSALNPTIPVGEQIAEIFRHHRSLSRANAREAAAEMLGRVQISDPLRVLRRYPHELSGGQQQRVVIAMALALDPELLVLDEPTTGLDATVESEVLDLVTQLRDELDASILYISHNLGLVARFCERVGVLYAGRLVEEGPARKLFSDPRHPYTLGLLRCVPRLGMHKSVDRLESIPGSLPPLGAEPAGCVFADRCALVTDHCRTSRPELVQLDGTRTSRCFRHAEVDSIEPPDPLAVSTAPGDQGPLLELQDVVKSYRSRGHETVAVAGVSVSIGRGEIFGLVGESGSGKTSLAKCIVGLSAPSDGRITFDGVELGEAKHREPEVRRLIQMIFQNPDSALNPRHSIRRILGRSVRLLAGLGSSKEREERLLKLVRSVRLEPRHLDVRPQALSGGLKQRVAIARSFAGSPGLVLCDEPVSALDVSVQAAILNLLVDLQRTGVSYVFISHDLAVVRYLADRIGVMYLGQLVDVGTADAVFSAPHHPYTEALLSAIPSLDLDGPGRHRVKLTGALPSAAEPPSGCRFHTRCPRALGDLCRDVEPPWQDAGGNSYRCHIPPDELGAAQGGDARRQNVALSPPSTPAT